MITPKMNQGQGPTDTTSCLAMEIPGPQTTKYGAKEKHHFITTDKNLRPKPTEVNSFKSWPS